MPPIHDSQRVAIIADSQNLYHTAHSLYSRNIDYTALLDAAVQDRELVRAIAYVIRADATDEEDFFDALTDIGFETKIKDIKTFADGSQKANWDLGMCLDAVTLAAKVDVVVLASGDGDFERLCYHLRHEGVRTEVFGFESSTAEELIDAADSFVDMSENESRYLL
ncbi:MAG: NYN domain-containing protein [Natronomonas sp.]